MPLYCLIADDEPLARELIQSYVERLSGIELAGVCTNLLDVYDHLMANPAINVVFMDVELPVYTAHDWTALADFNDRMLWVVLVTAYPPAYLPAQTTDMAFAVLNKPVSFERFCHVVDQIHDLAAKK
ncbi:response regulator [Rudanella paleaurantiibacter]|uniref:Response regulator n=1 Tax=Rudanella paleaurantiibacter TaxID=2614655 RepID=A0A7J5TTS3_9BACT|nr:response regulator [Rudanella paleaurantiibacter]KAB7727294.1 response regulator [Rudanella paleaurantiibacter]